jgi:hypothetical protein
VPNIMCYTFHGQMRGNYTHNNYNYNNNLACRVVSRQRLGKHIPAAMILMQH